MVKSVLCKSSNGLTNLQSNQPTSLWNLNILKQEDDKSCRKRGSPRNLIPQIQVLKRHKSQLYCKMTESNSAYSSLDQKKNVHIHRKPGRPRKVNSNDDQNNKKCVDRHVQTPNMVNQSFNVISGPISHPIWKGSICVCGENIGIVEQLAAHISTKASVKVFEMAHQLPKLLHAEMLPRKDVWPASLDDCPHTDDIIDLYIFPMHGSERAFHGLLNELTENNLVLKAFFDNVPIFVFSSLQFTSRYWRKTSGKPYLWAVFVGKNAFFPHEQEEHNLLSNSNCTVSLNLGNELQPVTDDQRTVSKNGGSKEYREKIDKVENTASISKNSESIFTEEAPCALVGKSIEQPTERAVNAGRLTEEGICGSTADTTRHDADATERTAVETHVERESMEMIEEETYRKNPVNSDFPASSLASLLGNVSKPAPQLCNQEHVAYSPDRACSESLNASVLNIASTFDDLMSIDDIGSANHRVDFVNSYSVQPRYAPILDAILAKYGDIARDFPISCRKILTSALESVCEAILDLKAVSFVELQRSHLHCLYSVIIDAEFMKLDVQWLRKRYLELADAVDTKEYENMQTSIKAVEKNIAGKKATLSLKKTEMSKLQSEIEALETEVAEGEAKSESLKEREKTALLNIKYELIDDNGYLASWSNEGKYRDCCKWRGITCSNLTGHVTALDLCFGTGLSNFKPLTGKVSDSLLELKHLTYLDLSSNHFGGSRFPNKNDDSLAKLRYLNLFQANFSGTISSIVRNLSSLESLDLSYNYLLIDNGDFEWVSRISSLTSINLKGNPLLNPNSWLQIINKLPHLENLTLSSCFSGNELPLYLSPVNSSSSLTVLDISHNNFAIPSIQPWLANISQNLMHLDLAFNTLLESSTLEFIGDMTSLRGLHLANTSLVGGIPRSIGNISGLSYLDMSKNNLDVEISGFIKNLSGCAAKSLQHLSLAYNELTGSLPDLSLFSSLKRLYLGNNRLNGSIDKSIGGLYQLERLLLQWNSLNGVVSEEHISNLTNLKDLLLSGNSLTWNVSLDWVPPFRLGIIHLQSCKLGPHFPNWLQSQKGYYELDISDNGISESIPEWFWDLSCSSFYLNLSYNLFSGSFPNGFLHFHNLLFLNLASNNFSGQLPTSIGSISRLETLNVAGNVFSGELPLSLRNCTMLRFLDLSSNRFSGNIPVWIGETLLSLQFLSLQSNHFQGSLPLQLCRLTNVQILDLSANNINGTMPHCLGNLKAMIDGDLTGTIFHSYSWFDGSSTHRNYYTDKALVLWKGKKYDYDKNLGLLRVIDFSGNNIGGEIPSEISILTGLKQLNLSNNKLTGAIPSKIGFLKQLEALDLSRNQISGRIPASMAGLHFLNTLNLSLNALSGRIPSSTQLQSFNVNSFAGNPALCGLPLLSKSPEDDNVEVPASDEEDEDEWRKWFYAGMGIGFTLCFCGVSGTVVFCRFQVIDKLMHWVDVTIAVYRRRL
ncbi:receptor-like protein EIX2 isoform X2 [Mercurialis annua]|uniref:receptor-like protein EIX2 isoform X2 n=1 Tax=Mercurialis annua TaxID=3986 RepID=UPI0021608C38|nr:receptor-like protein EIX2 isoform X2 [Mercurialis annua]